MPANLITLNKAKLPKCGVVGQVYYSGDTGETFIALPPTGKLTPLAHLEHYLVQKGPAGDRGERGEKGADSQVPGPPGRPGRDGKDGQSIRGERGHTGLAATVQVGHVRVAEVGESPSVVNVGDEHHAVLNFVLPRPVHGRDGKDGPRGERGEGVTGPRGEKGENGCAVSPEEIRAEAIALRDAKKKHLAAVVKARMAADSILGEHSRRMMHFILDHLEKDLK
jgi:hypothetical protein